jgi:hypothetical protein
MTDYTCYACGRWVKPRDHMLMVVLEDDDGAPVPVGPDCQRKVLRAGAKGYCPPRGGPRLFDSTGSRQTWLARKATGTA